MRTLNVIAREIYEAWQPVNYAAAPYLAAMLELQHPSQMYGEDDGKSIVLCFLSNARAWKGETAKRIKAELREML